MRIGVIGGGILGRLVAFFGVQQGFEVELFEKEAATTQTSTSFVAAGMLSPYCELEHEAWAKLGQLKYWSAVLTKLTPPVFFQQAGTLVVAHPLDSQVLDHWQNSVQRYFGAQVYCLVKDAELAELEPQLSERFGKGFFLKDEGQIDSEQVMHALAVFLTQHIKLHWQTEVVNIKPHQIFLKSGAQQFDWVVDCRGLAAKTDVTALRGVRGEIIQVHAPEVHLARPVRLAHPKHSMYVAPRENQKYLIGATVLEVEDNSQVSVQSALELLSAACTVHLGFSEARILKMSSQCRPALASNLPKVFWQTGLMRINGLFRHGYLLSPRIAELAVRFLVRQKKPNINVNLFEQVLDDQAYSQR